MNKTKIEYGDYAWNPIKGCKGIGCAINNKCWARQINNRFHYIKDFYKPEIDYKVLIDPDLSKKKPGRILTCFMGDFFGKGVQALWRQEVYNIIRGYPQHTFFILTKNPNRIFNFDIAGIPENTYIGVTINCKSDLWRKGYLEYLHKKGIKTFISYEPLLEEMTIVKDYSYIDWVIIGGMQRGAKPRPRPEWIVQISRAAKSYGVPVFIKNNIDNIWVDNLIQEYPK